MTSLVQANVTCLLSWETPTVILLPDHCLSDALRGGRCLWRATSSTQAGGLNPKDVWLSISYFGFVHSQHLLLPGVHHCIHDNGWPQQHTNINLNLVCVCVCNNLDHIWGLIYSNVYTFTALILPLKVLSYPKNNHHALFITYSTKAQQCVTSEKWHKTTKWHNWATEAEDQELIYVLHMHVETDGAFCLISTSAASGSVTFYGSVLIYVM